VYGVGGELVKVLRIAARMWASSAPRSSGRCCMAVSG